MNEFGTLSTAVSPLVSNQAMHVNVDRSAAPVFIVGCHRSGTNLLYDTLLSAGGFPIYRGYLPVYDKLIPRFGKFDKQSNRKRMIETWLRSKGFRRSGIDGAQLRSKILQECRTGGDFIRTVMSEMARQQSVGRWMVYNPDNLLHMAKIKAEIPNALFVHIVRDGRDIALSLRKLGFRPFPWLPPSKSLLATAMYWQWVVRRGQQYGRSIAPDYIEIRYEDLTSNPRSILKQLSEFLCHDLDYDRIQSRRLGRMSESNSSFLEEAEQGALQPMNRWKTRITAKQIDDLESVIGSTLTQLGYKLNSAASPQPRLYHRLLRAMYPAFFDTKLWLKAKTPIGRLSSLSILELSEAVAE